MTIVEPAKLRRRKKLKSTIGWRPRRSTSANIANATAAAISSPTVGAAPQPQVGPWMRASVRAVRLAADSSTPGKSTARGTVGSCDSGQPLSARATSTTATRTSTPKIQRQLSSPVRTPPTTTPMPETSSVAAPHRPIARPRPAPTNTLVRIDIDEGMSSAPPTPETAIAAMST